MAYSISGHVRKDGVPASRTIYVYSSADGSLVGSANSSSSDGSYSVATLDATPVFVLAVPDAGEIPQVFGPVTPVQG